MKPIKRSITFVVEAKKPKKGSDEIKVKKKDEAPLARVRCVVTWQGQRVRLSVKNNVNPDFWVIDLQRCRAKTYHGKNKIPASVINRSIDDLENLINGIFLSFEERDKTPTKAEFMDVYTKLAAPDEVESKEEDVDVADRPLFAIYDEFVKDGTTSGRWSKGTLIKTRTIKKHLQSISKTISLNDIIRGGVNLLIEHFNKVLDNTKKKGLANTTIKNDIAFVKVFMRWAQEHGYCNATPFLNMRVKLKTAERPVIFLTWDELMTVYNFDFGHRNYLAQVRDVFCFCCFTSLRYSDVRNLRRSNIFDTELRIITIKTHDSLTIELNKYSKAILDKYAHIPFTDDKALPVITNQKMNDYLKKMAKACGINTPVTITQYKGTTRIDQTYKKWELMSTHCGRRTFVCNALMLGIPANIVMKWTGHSDYATMRPYIEIADGAKRYAMTAFDNVDTKVLGIAPNQSVGQNVGQKDDSE